VSSRFKSSAASAIVRLVASLVVAHCVSAEARAAYMAGAGAAKDQLQEIVADESLALINQLARHGEQMDPRATTDLRRYGVLRDGVTTSQEC
jgi:hypothetical protein